MQREIPNKHDYVINATLMINGNPWLMEHYWEPPMKRGIKSLIQQHEALNTPNMPYPRYFAHVILYLPAAVIEDDRRKHNGEQCRELMSSLQTVHQHYYQVHCYGQPIRYQVIASDHVAEGSAVVAFGHAVYVPDPNENPQWAIEIDLGQGWQTAATLYPGQRLCLLSHNRYGGQSAVEPWPFDYDDEVLLRYERPDTLEVLSVPYKRLLCEQDGQQYQISNRAGDRILLRRVAMPAPASPSDQSTSQAPLDVDWQTVARPQASSTVWSVPTEQRVVNTTELDDEPTMNPLRASALSLRLCALALQPLSLYKDFGVSGLRIGFNARGDLIHPDAPGCQVVVAMDQDNRLAIQETAHQAQPITLPRQWQGLEHAWEIDMSHPPQGLSEYYLMFLRLPQAKVFHIPAFGRAIFGRGKETQVAPQLLEQAQLHGPSAQVLAVSPEKLGLSKRAASLSVSGKSLTVEALSGQPIWYIDRQGVCQQRIERPGSTLSVPPGGHVLMGHYLFRVQE